MIDFEDSSVESVKNNGENQSKSTENSFFFF
jgi:hypothetical protein